VDLDAVIDPLYDLTPGEFVAARDSAAKAARADGDRDTAAEITALRRPTVVAWLTNQLARRREDEMAQFLELGAALREATAALSGPELRELSRQRQALVTAMVREARGIARELTGSKVTEDVARGLEETLLAALADPDAAEEVRLGRLSGGLEQSGFTVGSSGSARPTRPPAAKRAAAKEQPAPATKKAAARPTPEPATKDEGAAARRKAAAEKAAQEAARRREEQRAELEHTLGEAWAAARQAAERRDDATAAATKARDGRRDAERRLHELEGQLREARETLDQAEDAERAARDERDRNETAAETARKVVTDLQARLDAL
jgi:hypothetical protein